jgi:peroxiredoxin Q/BCP
MFNGFVQFSTSFYFSITSVGLADSLGLGEYPACRELYFSQLSDSIWALTAYTQNTISEENIGERVVSDIQRQRIENTMLDNIGKYVVLVSITVVFFQARLLGGSGDEDLAGKVNIEVGATAPDFSLPDQQGEYYTLSQFRGSKNVILYFYPMDDTPGCTKEACNFRDDFSEFDSLDTVILGVSVDDVDSHKSFASKYDLNFPLLADTDKKVSGLYDTIAFYGKSKRHTFVIDKEGVIRKLYPEVDVERHSKEIITFIKNNLL